MSRVIPRQSENEISQDFEELMGHSNLKNDESNRSPSMSDNSETRDAQMMQHQEMMKQQQMMQQQMMQQQRMSQQQIPPPQITVTSPQKKNVQTTTEKFTNKSVTKSLTPLVVLLVLFYILSSKQVEELLNNVPKFNSLPFNEHLNILLRGLILVVVYYLLNRFIL